MDGCQLYTTIGHSIIFTMTSHPFISHVDFNNYLSDSTYGPELPGHIGETMNSKYITYQASSGERGRERH